MLDRLTSSKNACPTVFRPFQYRASFVPPSGLSKFSSTYSDMAKMMKAVVIYESGGPEVLKVEQRPVPQPEAGQVLINVKAFGLNRSEMFTRKACCASGFAICCFGMY